VDEPSLRGPDLAQRMVDPERRRAARWFGVAVAGGPILDVLDDAGWFTMLLELRHGFELPSAWRLSLTWTAFFLTVGFASAAIVHRMSRRDRLWFFGCAAVPATFYALAHGVRPASVLTLLALVIAGMRLVALPADHAAGRP
jgi:hypothetical protein